MLGNEQAAMVADSLQAEYFRTFLRGLRSELEADLAKQVRRLTVSQNRGDIGTASGLRRTIRRVEGDLRAVTRMVDSLDRRFPEAARTG